MAHKDIFNPATNQDDLDRKLIVAFEKLAETMRILQWDVAKKIGVSPLQLQILVYLQHHDAHLATPARLASEFNVTRPTITDALRSLEKKQLVLRIPSNTDQRSVSLTLSDKGIDISQKAEEYPSLIYDYLIDVPTSHKEQTFHQIIGLLDSFMNEGLVEPKRICFSCKFYTGDKVSTHHCTLLNQVLILSELRVDCPEHELNVA